MRPWREGIRPELSLLERLPSQMILQPHRSIRHRTPDHGDQQIRRLEKDFLQKGGLRERVTKARLDFRDQQKKK